MGDERSPTLSSWPRAILHVDADAFFASCEQAIHPELKGRPVITGKERGIVAAMSYEAKAKGVVRGMRIFEAKKACPRLVALPSDYETYSLFSVRMFDIFRRFSPDVEEYSIDEAFVDLTGLRRIHRAGYREISGKIQDTVRKELDLSVSCGVSVSKVLAKIGSKLNKPRGLTAIPGDRIHDVLAQVPVEKVWGIGPNTSALLQKYGVRTALDFARKNEVFVQKHLSKPYQIIWNELNGRSVLRVETEAKTEYQSISKTRTFTPPSADKEFVFGQLSKNLENACIKARRYKLAATRLLIFLRRQDFKESGTEIKIDRPSAYPSELLGPARLGFESLYRPQTLYRLTGVVLAGLVRRDEIQHSLFDEPAKIERMDRIYECMDRLSDRFGKHVIQHGSSLPANRQAQHEGDRGDIPQRKAELFKGESKRQRLGMPVLNVKV